MKAGYKFIGTLSLPQLHRNPFSYYFHYSYYIRGIRDYVSAIHYLKQKYIVQLIIFPFAGEVYEEWLKLRYLYLAISPEVSSLLWSLRQHYLLCLITNGPSRSQWEKIERLNLRPYFDCILVSDDLPWEKPDKNIFLKACNCLGVHPSNCVMVGDKLETDIRGGINASLGATIWLTATQHSPHPNPCPDFTINSVSELFHLFPSRFSFSTSLPDLEDHSSNASDGS